MKHLYSVLKHSLIPLFFFLSIGQVSAQIQNLVTLAEGELEYGSIIYDTNKDLLGYIYFFNQGEIFLANYQYEYVYLDKNLNKVANGKFTEIRANLVTTSFTSCTAMGDNQILLTKVYKSKGVLNETIVPVFFNRTISLNTSTVSEPFVPDSDGIKDFNLMPRFIREVYKKDKALFLIQGINIDNKSHYIVFESGKKKDYDYENGTLRVYNLDRKLLWDYPYNVNGTKKSWKDVEILRTTDTELILQEFQYSKDVIVSKKLVVLNLETGAKKFDYLLEDKNSSYNHTYKIEFYNDNYYIAGHFSPINTSTLLYNWEQNLGVHQIVLNEKGQEIRRQYHHWNEIKGDLTLSKYGEFKEGYRLIPNSFFMFKNGSFTVLSEKYSKQKQVIGFSVASKAENFILFNFDEKGSFTGNNIIEKDQNKDLLDNYLFSQYIKDNNGVVFFFRNYKKDEETKEKNWVLGINTIINGELNQEIVPMSSEDFFLAPLPAKEGYILLREYNKDDKYNQLRLEKLNF